MNAKFRLFDFVPAGFIAERITHVDNETCFLPSAVEVADRWHLMENASPALLDSVRKSMRQIRKTLVATDEHTGLWWLAPGR